MIDADNITGTPHIRRLAAAGRATRPSVSLLWLAYAAFAGLMCQPACGQTTPATTEAAPSPEGIFDVVFSGGWVGFLIVALLFALSMLAAYLVFEQIMTLRRSEIMPDKISDQVRALLAEGRVVEADKICRAKPSFLTFVLLNGLAEVDGGWHAVEKAMEDATAEQSARLFRKVEYLSVIGNIAPMVGLLGTVTGMIFAFQQVASTQGAAGAGDLAEGIYQALVTTVGGLIVAIPSLGAFAIFRNRVDQLVAEAAYLAQHAFAPLKRRRPTVAAVAPAQSAPPSAPPRPGGI
ncbi:MAG: MotA/TolQ/ExbB proton channel family protein [Planctomycetales bacterium]|nr:MotA/TolQ/ExbB proton channel family protein [Planctomycetales bacterium]